MTHLGSSIKSNKRKATQWQKGCDCMSAIIINENVGVEKPKVKERVKVKMSREEFEMKMLEWIAMKKKEMMR